MFNYLKKNKTLTGLLIIVLLFLVAYAFDYVRAQTFEIEVVEISPVEPVADGETPVSISVKLEKRAKPVEGHNLFMIPMDGGVMKANRQKTDSNGMANFTYYPYRATILQPARTVTIRVYDEDNSVFVIVNAKLDFEIKLKEA